MSTFSNRECKTVVLLSFRVTLAVILGYAGVQKLHKSNTIAEALNSVWSLPHYVGVVLQRVIPLIEIAIAVWLFTGYFLTAVASATAGLLLIFTVFQLASNSARAGTGCICFGEPERSNFSVGLARNIVMLGGTLIIVLASTVVGVRTAMDGPHASSSSETVVLLGLVFLELLLFAVSLSIPQHGAFFKRESNPSP